MLYLMMRNVIMLNLNPVLVAKNFQYRVETLFTEVLLSESKPVGKIVYFALHIEFQMRGSLHLNALIWTEDCPKLTSETKEYYIEYIDKHVRAYCTYPKKMMTLNYMIWLTSTKNILIPKLVENTRIHQILI